MILNNIQNLAIKKIFAFKLAVLKYFYGDLNPTNQKILNDLVWSIAFFFLIVLFFYFFSSIIIFPKITSFKIVYFLFFEFFLRKFLFRFYPTLPLVLFYKTVLINLNFLIGIIKTTTTLLKRQVIYIINFVGNIFFVIIRTLFNGITFLIKKTIKSISPKTIGTFFSLISYSLLFLITTVIAILILPPILPYLIFIFKIILSLILRLVGPINVSDLFQTLTFLTPANFHFLKITYLHNLILIICLNIAVVIFYMLFRIIQLFSNPIDYSKNDKLLNYFFFYSRPQGHPRLLKYLVRSRSFPKEPLILSVPTYLMTIKNSRLIEIIWTVIPLIILMFIAVPSFQLLYDEQLSLPSDLTVKILGHQWYWSYEYNWSVQKKLNTYSPEVKEELLTEQLKRKYLSGTSPVLNLVLDEQVEPKTSVTNLDKYNTAMTHYNVAKSSNNVGPIGFSIDPHNMTSLEYAKVKRILKDREDWLLFKTRKINKDEIPQNPFLEKYSNVPTTPGIDSSDINFILLKFDSYMLAKPYPGSQHLKFLAVDEPAVLIKGKIARLLISSSDVIHSWTVPQLGVKMDAIPGRINEVEVLPDAAGVFYGQCSEICGENHGFMPIVVRVTDINSFNLWLFESKKFLGSGGAITTK